MTPRDQGKATAIGVTSFGSKVFFQCREKKCDKPRPDPIGPPTPKAALTTLAAFELRYDVPVVFASTAKIAARQVEIWAWCFARKCVEKVNDLAKNRGEANW